jgi:hypothetical protein
MSPVQNIWRQLVQRRLWPVAIVLVAGLAAVPMLLAKDPEPAPAPPAPAAVSADDELAAQPIVAEASVEETATRDKVLGKRKNPFAVEKADPATETTDKASDSVVTKTPTSDDGTSGSSGSAGDTPSGGGAAPAPAPTTPVEPAPKPKVYAQGELTVRFSGGEGAAARQSVKKGRALPSADEPVLIYTGLADGGKYAEFLVADGVVPVGDGDCLPSPELCERLRLRTGETEFFDVTDETGAVAGQFQLDLVKIHKGTGGASASRSKSSAKPSAARAAGLRADASTTELRSSVGAVVARLP